MAFICPKNSQCKGCEYYRYDENLGSMACFARTESNSNNKETTGLKTLRITKPLHITPAKIRHAEQCLVDNGIEEDEAYLVLQALGYILLDEELYPE